jgi:cbb3-type cytochrome oxidase maturation protein
MDILYLLIPLSVVLVFLIIGVFAWAVNSGQFDDLEREGERILDAKATTDSDRPANVDPNQGVD